MESNGSAKRPDWRDTLEACGLAIVGGEVPASAPTALKAIQAVTGVDVQPTFTVDESQPDAMDELDRQWYAHSSKTALIGSDGEFLVLPPQGGSTVGWVRVKDPIGKNLPSRIASTTGSPEFLALSVTGNILCAVSVEEDEYWIVVRSFA